MNTRTLVIAAVALVGLVFGPAVLRAVPNGQPAIGWFTYLLVFGGCAIGLPVGLASLGTGGRYRSMTRLWSLLGVLAILLVTSGASAAVLSLGSAGLGPSSLLSLASGAGMLAGLAMVKLAVRKARARMGDQAP
jgi:hypothetical protein